MILFNNDLFGLVLRSNDFDFDYNEDSAPTPDTPSDYAPQTPGYQVICWKIHGVIG